MTAFDWLEFWEGLRLFVLLFCGGFTLSDLWSALREERERRIREFGTGPLPEPVWHNWRRNA